MIGRWIDSLSDEERDRIVEAQGWGYGALPEPPVAVRYAPQLGQLCVMDNAFGRAGAWHPFPDVEPSRHPVARRYDRLCMRFGLARVTRAIKLRASALRSSDLEAPHVPHSQEVAG